MSAMDEFTPFPRLPEELRRLIWNTALFTPKVLGLSLGPADDALAIYGCAGWDMTQTTTSRLLLRQVCRESRVECFRAETIELLPSCKGFHKSFRNQVVDVVFFLGGAHTAPNLRNDVLTSISRGLARKTPQIPRLALQVDWVGTFFRGGDPMGVQSIFAHLNSCCVEELIFVIGKNSICRHPDVVLVQPMTKLADAMPESVISDVMGQFNITTPEELTWDYLETSYLTSQKRFMRNTSEPGSGIDPDAVGWDAWYEDPAEWKFKKIIFMEATTPDELQKRALENN
ncbi:hypothetical protein IFR05_005396 [Cadophora sp. M221]|nr:hypothetical protein IFR05_005396 [Cadophora sp. M221]